LISQEKPFISASATHALSDLDRFTLVWSIWQFSTVDSPPIKQTTKLLCQPFFWKINTARETPAAVLLIYKKGRKRQALYKQGSQIQGTWRSQPRELKAGTGQAKEKKKLSIHAEETMKNNLLVRQQVIRLNGCLLKEPSFPACKRRSLVVEDEAIPLLPDEPGPKHNKFHEEGVWPLLPCFCHHLVEAYGKVLINT
jgi:hypothetical protein